MRVVFGSIETDSLRNLRRLDGLSIRGDGANLY